MEKELTAFLENEQIKKVGHNIKYDLEVFHRAGVHPKGIHFDTMLAAYVLNAGVREYSLDALSFSEFGYQKIPISALIGKGTAEISMADVPLEKIAPYACEDADFTPATVHCPKKATRGHRTFEGTRHARTPPSRTADGDGRGGNPS